MFVHLLDFRTRHSTMDVFTEIETTQSWHTQLLSECITRNLFNGHLDDQHDGGSIIGFLFLKDQGPCTPGQGSVGVSWSDEHTDDDECHVIFINQGYIDQYVLHVL